MPQACANLVFAISPELLGNRAHARERRRRKRLKLNRLSAKWSGDNSRNNVAPNLNTGAEKFAFHSFSTGHRVSGMIHGLYGEFREPTRKRLRDLSFERNLLAIGLRA